MKQTTISNKEASALLAEYHLSLSKKDLIAKMQSEKHTFLSINHYIAFFLYQNKFVPTLRYLQSHHLLKMVAIDMGAIKFIVNGADVMRPGIQEIDSSISKEDTVAIVDINNKKPIAVGIAQCSAEEMKAMSNGKVIKNIHFVGDEIWKLSSEEK